MSAQPIEEAYDDERVARRARLIWQLAGAQDSTRHNYELADRLKREVEFDFKLMSPGDQERIYRVIRRATNT